MRVILINRFFYPDHSATSQLASDLTFDLAARGENVMAITSRKARGSSGTRLQLDETIYGVRVLRIRGPAFGRPGLIARMLNYAGFFIGASSRLLGTAQRGDIVIAMTDPPLIGVAVCLVVWARGAQLVNWHQDVFPETAERLEVPIVRRIGFALRWLRDGGIRAARDNVAVGSGMARLLAQSSGRVQRVIPNWALAEVTDGGLPGQAPASRSGSQLRADWGIEEDFVVGYSGNMGRAHQLETLVDAAKQLEGERGIVFLLIGDGFQRAALEERVRRLALTNVVFKPYQSQRMLRESLSVPNIHVVSLDQRLEGLVVPSKFVGAIALGQPVLWLGAPDGEIGSLVREWNCGICVPQGDIHALAEAVLLVMYDRLRLRAMSENALQLWRWRFQRRRALDAWYKLLASCVQELPSA